jgi:DNA-binding CsgD family transcriptional regulator
MDSFSSRLFSRLNDTVAALQAVDRQEDLAPCVLAHLPRLVAMDNIAFFPLGEDEWQYVDVVSPGLDPALFEQYSSYYEFFDIYKDIVYAGTTGVDRSADLMDYAAWAMNPHRAEFLLPNGMYHLAGIQIMVDGRLIGDVSFYRDVGPDFTDLEMAVLRELRRHLGHAFARCRVAAPPPVATPYLPALFTPREQEIARLLMRGLSNASIAGRLSISVNTLKTHLKHLMAKTGCRTRTELAYALFTLHGDPGETP